ncbi:MAG: YCF48-related protein [Motiliproteus sp.]
MAFFVTLFSRIVEFCEKPGNKAFRTFLVASIACLSLLPSAHSVAGTDRLQLPAIPSALASRSLLLDMTRTAERLYAVGERGHIIYSNDQGNSWQQASVPVSVSLTAIDFADADHGWAVGHDGVILASDDGGLHWSKQLDGLRVNQALVDLYQDARDKLSNQLQQAESNGADVEVLQEQLELLEIAYEDALIAQEEGPTKPFLDVLFVDKKVGWAIGAYGLIFETRDGGQQWLPKMLALDNPDGFHLNSMLRTQRGELLIAGEAGILFRSEDLGKSWQRLESPYDGSFYSLVEIQPAATLLVVGLRGRAFSSNDRGEHWQTVNSATRSTLSAAKQLSNGELILAGNGGAISVSGDGGEGFVHYIQPERRGFTALVETADGHLVLAGQGGITRLSRQQLGKSAQ